MHIQGGTLVFQDSFACLVGVIVSRTFWQGLEMERIGEESQDANLAQWQESRFREELHGMGP